MLRPSFVAGLAHVLLAASEPRGGVAAAQGATGKPPQRGSHRHRGGLLGRDARAQWCGAAHASL